MWWLIFKRIIQRYNINTWKTTNQVLKNVFCLRTHVCLFQLSSTTIDFIFLIYQKWLVRNTHDCIHGNYTKSGISRSMNLFKKIILVKIIPTEDHSLLVAPRSFYQNSIAALLRQIKNKNLSIPNIFSGSNK